MSTPADRIAAKIEGKYRALHDRYALPDTCEVLRPGTPVSDGRGGETATETTIGVYRCALDVAGIRGEEGVSGAIEAITRPYLITLPYGADVTEQDTIGVGDRRFAVENVRTGGGYDVATEVTAREV